MRFVSIIGIGAGHPDFITVQAIKAMQAADVLFVPDKGEAKAGLRLLREAIVAAHAPGVRVAGFAVPPRPERSEVDDYPVAIAAWRRDVQSIHRELIATEIGDNGRGGFLVWGDPALYDGTLATMAELHASGQPAFDYDVIPGISAVAALTAAHKLPLNRIGQPVAITTGRRLAAHGPEADTVAVMLDGETAFDGIDDEGLEIAWGAYLGTPEEILIAGPLVEVKAEIKARRAAARAARGWVMDTYLLRRR